MTQDEWHQHHAMSQQPKSRSQPPVPVATGWAQEAARALVARWEHGDEAHRQWLRDVAIPDIAAALAAREPLATGWAVQRYGYITVDVGPEATEASAWLAEIGSDHPLEIREAKARGARAFRCELREVDNATSEAKPE